MPSGIYPRTEEYREKLTKRILACKHHAGPIHSEEQKEKWSLERKGRFLGKRYDPTGHKVSEKTKRKISKANSKPAPWKKGINNGHWMGDRVGYSGIHKWVAYWRGKPKECELCKTNEVQRFDWASINHKYKRNLNDWLRLCPKCHKSYDLQTIN